jgi:hypothetical protein
MTPKDDLFTSGREMEEGSGRFEAAGAAATLELRGSECVREGEHDLEATTIGIYKISRDRSERETSHKMNVNESTWVNE